MGTSRTAQLNADRKTTLAIDTADAAASVYAKWLDAVKADHDELAQTAIIVRGLKDTLRAMYASQTETLAEFGLTPRKVGKRTVDTKLQAVARAKETRKARRTMGKVQRKEVKGNVEVKMVVTPV